MSEVRVLSAEVRVPTANGQRPTANGQSPAANRPLYAAPVTDDAAVGFEAAEALLLEAAFEDCRTLWYSSNYVYLCQMTAPSGGTFAAVYKPLKGESPLWDFPEGRLYRKEVAAYRLSQLLEWTFIPPTVARDGPHGIGSVQLFVSHNQESHFFEQRENPELIAQLQRICVFDAIANNADRKGGHCLLDEAGRIWGIDHGLCFHSDYKLRSVIWDWADDPIPEGWLEDVARLRDCLGAEAPETLGLLEMMSPAETRAMLLRMDRLLIERRFPKPGPNRHYPWPLV